MPLAVMWTVFTLVIGIMVCVDLFVLQRRAHVISFREAATWSAVWISVAFVFCGWVWFTMGQHKALEFLAGYLVEESLSVDNLFVFIMIFASFNVPLQFQPQVLKWGIIGALAMRLILILVGIQLLHIFHWIIYVFGGVLLFTGLRMAFEKERHVEPEKNWGLRIFKRLVPVTTGPITTGQFFVRLNHVWHATPLFVTLFIVEMSDVVFAVDSIPAVIAISPDPFIVYTSNAFAILGLRSLFFVLSGLMGMFHYLQIGVSVILCFVGVKMLVMDLYKIPIAFSLGVIASILVLSIAASLVRKQRFIRQETI